MERKRNTSRSARHATTEPHAWELRPERAFVLHLDTRARPPRRVAGRVEHITSGQIAHVASLRELMLFLAEVLRKQVRSDRETTRATHVVDHRDGGLTPRAPDSLEKETARAAARPILRGRKKARAR